MEKHCGKNGMNCLSNDGKKAHTTGDFIWFSYIRLRKYNNHFKKISLKSDCVCVFVCAAYFIWRGNNLFGIMLKINGFSKGFFFHDTNNEKHSGIFTRSLKFTSHNSNYNPT